MILIRCCAHTFDLCIKDYCQQYHIQDRVATIADNHHVVIKVTPTRWTSYLKALEKAVSFVSNSPALNEDLEIVKLFTVAILQIERNFCTLLEF